MNWKFSLRDLLLATLVVALAVGWWTDRGQHLQKAAEQQRNIDKQSSRITSLCLQIERMKVILDREGLKSNGCQLSETLNSISNLADLDPFAPGPTADAIAK